MDDSLFLEAIQLKGEVVRQGGPEALELCIDIADFAAHRPGSPGARLGDQARRCIAA